MLENESKQIIEAGSSILNTNQLPTDLMLSAITNTSVGMDLTLIGMARNQTKELNRLFNAMSKLEEQIFIPEVMNELEIPAKIELYREAKQSFEFRVRFIRDVQNKVDWNKLQNELLSLKSLNEQSTNKIPKEAQKTLKEVLKHSVTTEWKLERTND